MSGCGDAFFRQTIARRRTAWLPSLSASECSFGAHLVDDAGMVARKRFERHERGAAARRAVVLEPSAEQLDLLAKPELRDRPVGLRADAEVRVSRRHLQVVVPLEPQRRERLLVAGLDQLLRLRRRLCEGQAVSSERGSGPT